MTKKIIASGWGFAVLFRMVLFVAVLFLFHPWAVMAQDLEAQYQEAAEGYHRLKSDENATPKDWAKVGLAFQRVHQQTRGSPRAADALYSAGLSYRKAWENGAERGDLLKALETFSRFYDLFPSNRLADDSLIHQAYLRMANGDEPAAKSLYRRLLDHHRDGDQAPLAEKRLKALQQRAAMQRGASNGGGQANSNSGNPAKKGSVIKVTTSGTLSDTGHPQGLVRKIQVWSALEWTRVIMTTNPWVGFKQDRLLAADGRPERLYFDLRNARPDFSLEPLQKVGDTVLKQIRVSRFSEEITRVVLDLEETRRVEIKEYLLPTEKKIVVDIYPTENVLAKLRETRATEEAKTVASNAGVARPLAGDKNKKPAAKPAFAPKPKTLKQAPVIVRKPANNPSTKKNENIAKSTKSAGKAGSPASLAVKGGKKKGSPSLATASASAKPRVQSRSKPLPESKIARIAAESILKVSRVMIDPGHGGRDPGAVGHGLKEKDLTLAISKSLKKLIERKHPKLKVGLTRDGDKFTALDDRPKLAMKFKADLFVSVHFNANTITRFHGVETYFLNMTNDRRAIKVAARENNTSEQSASGLNSILLDLLQDTNIVESSELAVDLQNSLVSNLKYEHKNVKNLGVKQAPFLVLMGAQMPSVLIEAGFLTNPMESSRLKNDKYLKRIAEGIYEGLRRYIEKRNIAHQKTPQAPSPMLSRNAHQTSP